MWVILQYYNMKLFVLIRRIYSIFTYVMSVDLSVQLLLGTLDVVALLFFYSTDDAL